MALVDDNKYQIPYITGNTTFADWVSHYNTSAINKLNLLETYRGVSGDGIVFTMGTTASNDPVGGATSGPDLPSGTFRCDISETISRGVTFQGDVSIKGQLNYDLTSLENPTLAVRLYPEQGYTGTKGFTFGQPIRVARANHQGIEGCTGDVTYYMAKADSANSAEVLGVVSGITFAPPATEYTNSNTYIEATLSGKIKGDFSHALDPGGVETRVNGGLSAGVIYFLSPGVSGGLTHIEPGIAGQVSKPVILGLTADEGLVVNYRGQLLKGSGTGGTGGINDNRFIIPTTNADLVTGVVAGYYGGNWIKVSSDDENRPVDSAVGLVINDFELDSTNYIEIVSCGHVNNMLIPDGSHGLLYVNALGQLTSSSTSIPAKPFAVAWPSTTDDAGTRRGVIINQNAGGGAAAANATSNGTGRSLNGNWAYSSSSLGGTTYGSAINDNVLINGGFDIWQRGIGNDSAYSGTDTTYFADRWVRVNGASGGGAVINNYSLERKEFPMWHQHQYVYGNPKYYLSSYHSFTGTGGNRGAGDFVYIENRIEDVRTLSGQDVTLSFNAKCGITGATMGIVVTHLGGGYSNRRWTNTVAQSSVGTQWGKQEIAFQMPSPAPPNATEKHFVAIGFDVTTMDTTLDLAKVKLEKGLVATTNVASDEDEELRKCSRFYQRSYNIDENTHSVTMLDNNNPTITVIDFTTTPMKDLYFKYPVRMRGIPTVVNFFSPKTGSTGDAYNRTAEKDIRYTSGTISPFGTRVAPAGDITIIAEHKTRDGMYIVVPNGTVLWDQISTHYVADAELDEEGTAL